MGHSDPWINYITILLENFVFSNFWKNFFLHFFYCDCNICKKKFLRCVNSSNDTFFFLGDTWVIEKKKFEKKVCTQEMLPFQRSQEKNYLNFFLF